VAVVMAIIDLQKMNRGVMDASGRGPVIAGLVIVVAKFLLVAAFVVFAMLN
jgi:hypothetical protein